jgi:hypothetical protein
MLEQGPLTARRGVARGRPAGLTPNGLTMRIAIPRALVAALVMLVASGSTGHAAAQEPAWQNTILGTVVDEATRGPIAGAAVSLLDPAGDVVRSTVTDEAGRFRIGHPDRGDAYRLRVEHVAYATSEGAVRFDSDTQLRMEVVLATRVLQLDPIVVTERRVGRLHDVGFYERSREGRGVFVEVDEALRRRSSRVTQFLVGKPSLRIARMGVFGDEDVLIAGAGCQPAIYLDGVMVRQPGNRDPNDLLLSQVASPDMIAGVEVFRRATEVPPRWGGVRAMCGVILLWTR